MPMTLTPFTDRYPAEFNPEQLIIERKKNEVRSLSIAFVPVEIHVTMSQNEAKITFRYLITEKEKREPTKGGNKVEVFTGRYTQKITSITLMFDDLSELQSQLLVVRKLIRQMKKNIKVEAVRHNYKIVDLFLDGVTSDIAQDATNFFNSQENESKPNSSNL
jgi:hypothetical protein